MSNPPLKLTEISGSPAACGAAYGEEFETAIMGFCRMEVQPNPKRLNYARKCWKHVERFAPASAKFMEGIARGAHLPRDIVTILTLHEEFMHQPHCTALAATGQATRDGTTIIGQNWDWNPHLYPWPGLLRLKTTGVPRSVTYHFPGLWACAGINEAGLALVWTSGGYVPKVPPAVGVPTYVLIAEILRLTSVQDAIEFLSRVPNAGSFIFFLADAQGEIAVVEALPGKLEVDRSSDIMSRANHYICKDILQCGKQVSPSRTKFTTLQRHERMIQLLDEHAGKISPAVVKAILTDRTGEYPWLHQFPGGKKANELPGMTINSFFAVAEDRTFWTCRGGRVPGKWQKVTP